jgi:predicted transcriptional regulator
MPRRNTPIRTSISCSLPPDMADRLLAEADARIMSPSALIERAVRNMFEDMDAAPPAAVLPTRDDAAQSASSWLRDIGTEGAQHVG